MQCVRATRSPTDSTAVPLTQLPAHPGGWYVWVEARSANDAEVYVDQGRWTSARTYTVPAGAARAFRVPAFIPTDLRCAARGSGGSTVVLTAHPVKEQPWPSSEWAMAGTSTTSSDFSSTELGTLPPDADAFVVKVQSNTATTKAVIKVEGTIGAVSYHLGNIYLGYGFIEDRSTAAPIADTSPSSVGEMPTAMDELELLSRVATAGGGGPFGVKFWGRMTGQSAHTFDVLLASHTLTNGATTGDRTRVLLGGKGLYDQILYSVTGTFSGDTIAVQATGRGQEAESLDGESLTRARRFDIVPGAFTSITLTSEGVVSGEIVTAFGTSYRMAA